MGAGDAVVIAHEGDDLVTVLRGLLVVRTLKKILVIHTIRVDRQNVGLEKRAYIRS